MQAAAREAGRAMGTAPDPVTGHERTLRAAQLAVADQSVDLADLRLAYAPTGAGCDAAGGCSPALVPGEEFSVCVTVMVRIPLLPEFVDANTATGSSSSSATATSTAAPGTASMRLSAAFGDAMTTVMSGAMHERGTLDHRLAGRSRCSSSVIPVLAPADRRGSCTEIRRGAARPGPRAPVRAALRPEID
ncbi:hypothetical protein QOZ88_14630 [Blastococcus sp. BMG 814]|uniref:Uncharacterized protein n=1 Tax=Blastococcus carthaginiensis TaxID=3050034 RepID=A0ABT9IE75_9ACTN|nr:hypothetical protein [Blastococcus carthaginiensis]